MVSMRSTVPAFGSAPSSVRIGGNRRMLRKQLAMQLGAFAIAIAASVQASPTVHVLAPAALLGSIGGGGDCNDLDAAVYPGHAEVVGNGYDDDCDGLADEDAADHPSNDAADHDGDQVIIAPDAIFASGFESAG